MMTTRFAFLRGLLHPALLPTYFCKASNGSHPSGIQTSAAKSDCNASKMELTKCLNDQGIPADASEQIVSHLPTVNVDQHEVHRTLNSLASLQFGQDRLVHLLQTHPGLILISSDRIGKCYADLASIFTQNYVYKILLNSPDVVEQKRSELAEKINYLNKILGVPNAHIVNSSALSYPITHMRLRSEFLKRCGILKPSTKRDVVMTVVDLDDMFSSNDEQFATKVAKLTLLEYEAFSTLYSMEESDSEWESDSDSD